MKYYLILLVLFTFGCSDPEPRVENSTEPKAEESGGVLTATQKQALDKAKAVEGMLQDADQKRRQEMDR